MTTLCGMRFIAWQTIMTENKGYIPVIDGLRAVAITFVVSYHYFPKVVEFGFLGVDIFFVISGYVITRSILYEFHFGEFKAKTFFEKRIRRLAPATLVSLLFTLVISMFLMLPSDLESIAKASISNLLNVQNFLFSSSIGYFDTSIRSSPVLHTWSLAVEEQFYLLAPLFVFLIARTRRNHFLLFLCLTSFASFASVILFSESHPAAIFYLLPFRAFELLAGVILAAVENEPYVKSISRRLPSVGLILALLILFISCANFEARDTFPNVTVLPIIMSTIAIIVYAKARLAKIILGNKLMVTIGKLSFSLYLYHYPVLKLAETYELRSIGVHEKIALLIFTGVTSWCSFRFLENRYRVFGSTRELITTIGLISILIVGLSSTILIREGYIRNFDIEKKEFLEYYDRSGQDTPYLRFLALNYGNGDCESPEILKMAISKKCFFPAKSNEGSETVVLWGDSHAHHLLAGFKQHLPQNVNLLVLTMNGCAPEILPEVESSQSLRCQKHNRTALKKIQSLKGVNVVISTVHPPEFQKLKTFLREFRNASPDSHVLFIGPAPSYVAPFSEIFINRFWNSREVSSTVGLDESAERREKKFISDLRRLSLTYKITYFSVYSKICSNHECQFRISPNDRQIFIWDHSHLSIAGSIYVGKEIVRMMNLDGPRKH